MRFAIVSDIHANWQAWCAVREDLRTYQVDTVVCLGDVVGYGPNPQGVLNDVRQCCDYILKGNHEAAAVGQLDLDIFNPVARRAAEWTATQLDDEAKTVLRELPLDLEAEDLLFAHADPVEPEEWGYIEKPTDAQKCFIATDKRLTFIGHTHVPEIFSLLPDSQIIQHPPSELTLQPGARYLVNVGSVGEPRDGSVEASYCLFDTDTQVIIFRKVAFDLAALRRDLRQHPQLEMPWFLKEHLPGTLPEKGGHALRVSQVSATRIHVRASERVRIQVGRNQKLTTTPVMASMAVPAQVNRETKSIPAASSQQRRVLWLAGSFFVLMLAVLTAAVLVYIKISTPDSRPQSTPAPVPGAAVAVLAQPRVISLLAKDAQLHGTALKRETNNGEVNIGHWESSFDYVSWSFNVEQAGCYEVRMVYAVPATASGRNIDLSCGKARLFHPRLESTGAWTLYQTLSLGHLQLQSGFQQLNIKPANRGKQGLMNLRSITLQRVAD